MSYLDPPFEHDVFVSYAHGSGERLKHWSKSLVRELENDILDLVVEFDDIQIFIDDQLDPTRPLTDQLQGKVQASGLLLVIMSRRYLQSSWCNDEIRWFEAEIKRCQESGGVVLVVRAQSTDHVDWPDCLKDDRGYAVLGFQFHPDDRRGNEVVHPYGWPEPQPIDRSYFEELAKLSTIVTRKLKEIKARKALEEQAAAPRVRVTIEGQPHIYLQGSTRDPDRWATAKAALEGANYQVSPKSLPAPSGDLLAIQEARKHRLATLADGIHVHCLLGTADLATFEREIEAVTNDQMVMQAFGKSVPCVVLNRCGKTPVLAGDYGIEVIDHTDANWLDTFSLWLQRALLEGSQS